MAFSIASIDAIIAKARGFLGVKPAKVTSVIHIVRSVEVTDIDLPTHALLSILEQRGDIRRLLQGVADGGRGRGWDDDDDDDVERAFAAEMDDMRGALRRGDLPEFLHVLDRALPHDLKGEALALLRHAPACADRSTRGQP